MKIIQINGWLGRLNGPLARFIESESPDIVCLQEALQPQGQDLATFHDQYGYLSEIQKRAAMPNLYFTPAWAFEMAGTLIDVGLAILSKTAITDKRHFHVNNEYYAAKQVSDYQRNTRVFQSASIKLGNHQLAVGNYQGYLAGEHSGGDETSERLMEKVHDGLSRLPSPLIFCGDLNVSPDTPTIRVLDDLNLRNLTKEYRVLTTLSPMHRAPAADRDNVACDYVFISQDIDVKSFRVADEVVSDHKALVLDFEVK